MTVIFAHRLDDHTIEIVADRVWFGYGAERAVARKLFILEDCVLAIAGAHRDVDVARARNFDELRAALESQTVIDAVVVYDDEIYLYNCNRKQSVGKMTLFELSENSFAVVGCYHNAVSYLFESGMTAVDAVSRVHMMWNLDEPVDVVTVKEGDVVSSTVPAYKKAARVSLPSPLA